MTCPADRLGALWRRASRSLAVTPQEECCLRICGRLCLLGTTGPPCVTSCASCRINPARPQRVLVDSPEFEYFDWRGGLEMENLFLTGMWKRDATVQLAWISVADGEMKVLKSLGWRKLDRLSLSPDGRYIAYSATQGSEASSSSIYELASDASFETELVKGAGINEAPAWTPDGARVFFTSNRSGGFGLWSIAVQNGRAAGSPELVKPDLGRVSAMGFSSSGTYFYKHVTLASDVYIAELDPASSKLRGPAVRLTEDSNGFAVSLVVGGRQGYGVSARIEGTECWGSGRPFLGNRPGENLPR